MSSDAPFFCDYAIQYLLADKNLGKTVDDRRRLLFSGGLTIKTTVDLRYQRAADRAVREAIGTALNRDVIGQAAVGPVEAPVVNVDNYVYMPGQNGYQDNSGGWLAQDGRFTPPGM